MYSGSAGFSSRLNMATFKLGSETASQSVPALQSNTSGFVLGCSTATSVGSQRPTLHDGPEGGNHRLTTPACTQRLFKTLPEVTHHKKNKLIL